MSNNQNLEKLSLAERSPLANRLFGLGTVCMYGFLGYLFNNDSICDDFIKTHNSLRIFLDIYTGLGMLEGLGDVISGKHHYFISKMF